MKRIVGKSRPLPLVAGLLVLAAGHAPGADEPGAGAAADADRDQAVEPAPPADDSRAGHAESEPATDVGGTVVEPAGDPGQYVESDALTEPPAQAPAAEATSTHETPAPAAERPAEVAEQVIEDELPAEVAEQVIEDASPAEVAEQVAEDEPPGEMRDAGQPDEEAAMAIEQEPRDDSGETPSAGSAAGDVPATAEERPFGANPEDGGISIDTLADEPGDDIPAVPLAQAVTTATDTEAKPLVLLDAEVPPGTYQRLSWSATEMFEDLPVSTPVLVVNGKSPGPTLCLTAAVHGDELNGIEMVRRVMHDLKPRELSGAVIGVPIVNLQGFRRGSRYLPDRRDLNRYFPGNPRGSAASRIAHSFFTRVIENCDALIDLHTGSFDRANLPQLRADLRNPDVVTLTHGFGATVVLHSDPAEGTLRHAATEAGIATVTLEAGGPSQLELKEVMHGVKGIETLLHTLGMVKKMRVWGDQQPVYYRSSWVRANRGGILLADVNLGSTVRRGDLLGTITDPMTNASTNLYSPYSGRVIGMARNQVVMPGFAAFHVGIQTIEAAADEDAVPGAGDSEEEDEALALEPAVIDEEYVDGMSE